VDLLRSKANIIHTKVNSDNLLCESNDEGSYSMAGRDEEESLNTQRLARMVAYLEEPPSDFFRQSIEYAVYWDEGSKWRERF